QLDAPFYIGIDGAKLIFNDGDWLLIRLSGTEPVGRLYVESASLERAEHLASQLRRAFSD
ncbi:hypothetical protein EBR96_06340, partial [bacterium]|nr:hypothetical protein [bacterium]